MEGLKRGYKVYLLGKDTGFFREFEALGIHTINVPVGRGHGNGLNDLRVLLKLCYYFFKIRPNIIHNITVKPILFGTLAAGLFSRKSKVVNAVTGLGYAFASNGRSFTRRMMLFMLKTVFFLSPKKSQFIFQNRDDLAVYEGYGLVKRGQSKIIKGAGVDEVLFERTVPQTKPNELVKVTLVSRMLKDKGVFEFVEAAKMLEIKLKGKVLFRLVGGLDLQNPAFIAEADLSLLLVEQYLVWEGHRTDVKAVYEDTDIACLPSYREGMPKSLIEAMAMACPIITTRAPGCQECVDEGINGYLVPVGDAEILADRILRLVNDAALRIEMGKASRQKMMRDMSLSKVVSQTFEVYEA